MNKSSWVFTIVLMGILLLSGQQSIHAQDSVEALSDLVGAKAGQAEMALQDRGYTWIKTDKSTGSVYSYWTEDKTGKCVTINTEDGRYKSIVYIPDLDCQDSATAKSEPVFTTVDGQCKLYNKKSDNTKFKGICNIEQTVSDNAKTFAITFSNGQKYKFTEQSNGYKVETPEGMSKNIATMIDKGDDEVFKWGKWKLTVNASNTSENDTESEMVSSAERAGQGDFDATGNIPCAQAKGQPMGQCAFGVSREGNGTATVSVTLPDGRKRAIFFENGNAVSADLSQADGNMDFNATKENGLYMINTGNERYEIPQEVIYCG